MSVFSYILTAYNVSLIVSYMSTVSVTSARVTDTAQQCTLSLMDTGECASLWIGDLDSYMDEHFIAGLFAHTGEVVNVKLIRDKTTGAPSGYGFIDFVRFP